MIQAFLRNKAGLAPVLLEDRLVYGHKGIPSLGVED